MIRIRRAGLLSAAFALAWLAGCGGSSSGGGSGSPRNAYVAVPSDGIGPHTDYLANFPYLGKPH